MLKICIKTEIPPKPNTKDVIIILDDVNDRKESCEIISWIYDVDFELLNDCCLIHYLS